MSNTAAEPNFWVLIPARMGAGRLPGKPLADLAGEPMVVRVAKVAQSAGAARVVVATDSEAISRGLGLHSRSNYVGAMGVNGYWGNSDLAYFLKALNWPLNPYKRTDWGIMGINSQTSFAHIRDGTSNTILFG